MLDKSKFYPFTLAAAIIIADQITKAIIVKTVEPYTIGFEMFGDFLRIIHARNPGIAFSIGNTLPDAVRGVLFVIIPLIVLAGVVIYYFRSPEIDTPMRWCLAGVLGGGIGNLIDRIARPDGVVDFVDVKFYGLFGLQRWPTFNIADASVVVSGILLVISFLLYDRRIRSEQKG